MSSLTHTTVARPLGDGRQHFLISQVEDSNSWFSEWKIALLNDILARSFPTDWYYYMSEPAKRTDSTPLMIVKQSFKRRREGHNAEHLVSQSSDLLRIGTLSWHLLPFLSSSPRICLRGFKNRDMLDYLHWSCLCGIIVSPQVVYSKWLSRLMSPFLRIQWFHLTKKWVPLIWYVKYSKFNMWLGGLYLGERSWHSFE